MPPLHSAPLFKRWERGDEVSHSLKIACKTSRSVGPCADSSAPVPGSLCEKPPPSPPGRGERDGAGWQCLGAALPEHDVAPGGNASPRSSAFIPAPAARNRIWEGLSEAAWLREARSCSFGPSCASDSPHLALGCLRCALSWRRVPAWSPCHGWAQPQGEEGAWASGGTAVPGGSPARLRLMQGSEQSPPVLLEAQALPAPFFGCRKEPGHAVPSFTPELTRYAESHGERSVHPADHLPLRDLREPVPGAGRVGSTPDPRVRSAGAPGELRAGCEGRELGGAAGAGSACTPCSWSCPKPVAELGLTPGAPRAEPDPLWAHLPCKGMCESVVQLSQESTACTNSAETPVSQPALSLSTVRILLWEEKHLFFR